MAGVGSAQPLTAFLESSNTQNFDARQSATEARRAAANFAQAWGALVPALSANGGWTHNQYPAVIRLPEGTGTKEVTIIAQDQLEASLKAEVPLVDASR